MKREKITEINWQYIQQAIQKKGMTMRSLSVRLGFDESYLAHRKTLGWLWNNTLELIAFLLDEDYKKLILEESTKSAKPETTDMDKYIIEQFGKLESMISVQTKLINTLIDDLIVLHKEIKQYRV